MFHQDPVEAAPEPVAEVAPVVESYAGAAARACAPRSRPPRNPRLRNRP